MRIRKEKVLIKGYYYDDLDTDVSEDIIGIFDTYEEAEKVFKEECYSEEKREVEVEDKDSVISAYIWEAIEIISVITG